MRRGIKLLSYMFATCFVMWISIYQAQAEEKEIAVNISNDLHNCTIWVTPKDSNAVHDNWTVSVITPTKEVYQCVYNTESSGYYCSFDYLNAGEWTVSIQADDVIPQTQIAVRATQQVDGTGNITISKGIAGLQIYVLDNKAVVEWTDNTVGNVNIKVFDTDTYKVLDESKTDTKYYECEFSDTVDKVTVTVVPSNYAKDKDAEVSVTLKANYVPKGTVTFSDIEYTNQLTYPCTVSLQQSYVILSEVNGKVYDLGTYNAGNHEIPLDLQEGNNDIKVYLKEDNGSRKSFSSSVYCDLIKPTLTMNREYDGLVTDKTTIQIEGKAVDFDKLIINGVEQTTNDDGTFSCQCGLYAGSNKIEVIVRDKANNETSYIANVTVGQVKKNSSSLATIITLGFYAVIIILLIKVMPKLVKSKKKEEVAEDEELEDAEESEEDYEDE